ncbi:glycerate kinase [Jejubacter calystegiae]|uniref:Glycerate kinase n=1 Tax=Jejubacter calystegiae TaxID=2579935 RepID=A0A4P8YGP1_9ENTR|nr:glycerate kinase [Jejubacter calystegiae]QCT19093.1 glycerate kinase [Jejubacter calystegiae]
MKIVIALDSFKGSCSARAACSAVAEGLRRVSDSLTLIEMPISDGGEGMLAALQDSPLLARAQWHARRITGPYGQPTEAGFMQLPDGSALIEMAQCCGLELTPAARRDVRHATSYGLGELLSAALDVGCRDIVIGLGGSATNDGGLGFAQALGARFWHADGTPLKCPATAVDLACVDRIDLSALDPRLARIGVQASCDVTNPLLGEQGATRVYGAQKGADATTLNRLEAGMSHYAQRLILATGRDVSRVPGAGAAGGMGAALLWYTDARLRPGIELVLSLLNADTQLHEADLVFTGEGRLDSQSVWGKAPIGVAHAAARHGAPVIALCGGRDESSRQLYQHHIDAMWSICPRPLSLEQAMADAERLLADTAENALRTFLAGRRSPPSATRDQA